MTTDIHDTKFLYLFCKVQYTVEEGIPPTNLIARHEGWQRQLTLSE